MPRKKNTSLTAAEFAERLKNNPDYSARLSAQLARSTAVDAEAAPLVAELATLGYPVRALGELRRTYAPLPSDVVELLLKWLPKLTEPALQDQLVRDLAMVREPYDVSVLTRLFEESSSDTVRWAIANTLAELRPLDARSWIDAALKDQRYGRSREMLPLALARTAPADEANRTILEVFDQMPAHAAIGLAESGGAAEMAMLRSRASREKDWVRKELLRAAKRIEERIR